MWLQFFSQNAHFAIYLFASLVSFAVCWLYVDAWTNRHEAKELVRWVGFGLLGVSFLLQATLVEQAVLGESIIGNIGSTLFVWIRVVAYITLVVGQILEPLQAVPKLTGLVLEEDKPKSVTVRPAAADVPPVNPTEQVAQVDHERVTAPFIPPEQTAATPAKTTPTKDMWSIGSVLVVGSKAVLPLGALSIAGLYWRRATVGLERHLKPVARAFMLLGVSELLYLGHLLRSTDNPLLFSWVAPYGPVWWLQHIVLLVGGIILGHWVWFYLTKRFFSQLFMIFMTTTVVIFLLVSVGFTSLLLQNIRKTSLHNLETAANVLDYALDTKKSEASAAAQQLAGTSNIVNALQTKDRNLMISTINDYLKDKKQTNIIVTNSSGQVLVRGQDTESWGDSMSDDPLVRRALIGTEQASVVVHEAVQGALIEVRSAQAVRNAAGEIIGAVVSSLELGPSFVTGLKQDTGLDSSIYANKVLAATTFVGPDGVTRNVGVKLNDKRVEKTVLKEGKSYTAPVQIQSRQMLSAFLPLKDVDNATIGMLLVAEPESNVLKAAGRSVELTFLLVAFLLIVSILPIYFIANGLVRQLD